MKARIAIPDSRARALDDLGGGGWRLWLSTTDFIHGTYLRLFSDGRVTRVTVRGDEGDEEFIVKGKN